MVNHIGNDCMRGARGYRDAWKERSDADLHTKLAPIPDSAPYVYALRYFSTASDS